MTRQPRECVVVRVVTSDNTDDDIIQNFPHFSHLLMAAAILNQIPTPEFQKRKETTDRAPQPPYLPAPELITPLRQTTRTDRRGRTKKKKRGSESSCLDPKHTAVSYGKQTTPYPKNHRPFEHTTCVYMVHVPSRMSVAPCARMIGQTGKLALPWHVPRAAPAYTTP